MHYRRGCSNRKVLEGTRLCVNTVVKLSSLLGMHGGLRWLMASSLGSPLSPAKEDGGGEEGSCSPWDLLNGSAPIKPGLGGPGGVKRCFVILQPRGDTFSYFAQRHGFCRQWH